MINFIAWCVLSIIVFMLSQIVIHHTSRESFAPALMGMLFGGCAAMVIITGLQLLQEVTR